MAIHNSFDAHSTNEESSRSVATHAPGGDAAPTTINHSRRGPTIFGLSGSPLVAVLVGWFFVVFDGYDLIVYGTVQGHLMEMWHLNPGQAGTVGSMAFVGMMLGAIFIGRFSDTLGRRSAILMSVVILSVFTLLCTIAPGPVWFGIFRLIAGFGLGGLVPSVNALVADLAPDRYRAIWATWMMSGVPIGGSLAAILAIFVIPSHPDFGWRFMFLFAAIPLVVGVPIALKVIPGGKPAPEELPHDAQGEKVSFATVLKGRYRMVSILFAVSTLVTLLAWYGLATWLPKLMQQSGYDLGKALVFTLTLNIGAVIGSFVTGWAGDTFGNLRSGVVAACLAAISLFALLLHPPVALVYVILILAGVGTHGTQILIIAAIANFYPKYLRGTGLGFALGFGRIGAVAAPQLAGILLGLPWASKASGVASNYILFGASAALSAILLAILAFYRRNPKTDLNTKDTIGMPIVK